MEDLFTALAPRRGTRPMMGPAYEIGTSSLSGGAISWGSVWNSLKNFGSSIKNFGNKVWNSSTGQALKQKLKDTDLQGKIVEGISTGIHGAVDLARQELDRQLANRLELPPPPPDAQVEQPVPTESMEVVEPSKAPLEDKKRPTASTYPAVSKRPLEEAEVTAPPAYDEIYPDGPPLVPTTKDVRPLRPMTRPHISMATPVLTPEELANVPMTLDEPPRTLQSVQPNTAVPAPPNVFRRPGRSSGWQSTLNSITGLGVRSLKKRRCYR